MNKSNKEKRLYVSGVNITKAPIKYQNQQGQSDFNLKSNAAFDMTDAY